MTKKEIPISQLEKKELQTSSSVIDKVGSEQLNVKDQEEKQVLNNLSSSNELEPMVELQSSPSPWMMWLKRFTKRIYNYLILTKHFILYKLGLKILNFRNRPPKILKYPHKKLSKVSESIDFTKTKEKDLVKIFRKMYSALMSQKYGMRLGIAAPQIGINKRIIIVCGMPMVNPEWKPVNAPKERVKEGCYSLDTNKIYMVERAKYGWAHWQNLKGEQIEMRIKGLQAIVLQHELNHLSGLCCNTIGEEVKVENTKYTNKEHE